MHLLLQRSVRCLCIRFNTFSCRFPLLFVVSLPFFLLKLLSRVFCLCYGSHTSSIATLLRSLAFAVSTRCYTFVFVCDYIFIF